MNNKDINFLLQEAVIAAFKASEEILNIYNRNFKIEYKSDESPLTEADKASHQIISQLLKNTGFPIISEESRTVDYQDRKQWSKYWLIDPIDGTKEFIRKNGEFTVNIAFIENGVPIIGVVLIPVTGTFYLASNNGSYKAQKDYHYKSIDQLVALIAKDISKLQKLKVSGKIENSLSVVMSKSHCNQETLSFAQSLENKYGGIDTISKGSSIKLCLVAEGTADIYIRIGLTSEWDTAAAHAVVKYAGGKVFIYDADISAVDYYIENFSLKEVVYNKKDLLNPYFVVSGINKDNV